MTNRQREFMGFLMGEGCFRIRIDRRKGRKRVTYTQTVQVALRDDEAEILRWAQQEYGGSLFSRAGRSQIPKQNPFVVWVLTSLKGIIPLLEQFLACELPTSKKQQAKLLYAFCLLKAKPRTKRFNGKDHYDRDEYEWMSQAFRRISEMKQYQV